MGSKKISIKAGDTSLDISDELVSMTDDLVNKLLPETRKELEDELTKIEEEARNKWLVRENKSKGSRNKLYAEIAITPNFELVGVIGNKAEYAWAIKVGKDTQSSGLQQGKRLSNELLFKPVKQKSKDFANVLANEITKQISK